MFKVEFVALVSLKVPSGTRASSCPPPPPTTTTTTRGHYAEIAPPHSYIDVADFPSPEALAQHLSRLDGDPAAYLSYFWWKDRYRSVWSKERKSVAFCELCRKLHDPSEPERVVGDLSRWWTGGAGDGCSGSSSSSSSQKWRRTPWPKYGDA